jgi:NAD(P)-dependent dehydrogenase (short-subunit alcohol dehydrogenase family)
MVTAGRPHYGRLLDMDFEQARSALDEHPLLMLQVARNAAHKVRPGGTLLFMGGTGGRRPGIGLGIVPTVTAALPALTASLALELAPVRVNLIAAGFVDTHPCRHRSSAMNSKTAAISFAPRYPSGASSARPSPPRSPYTS